MPLYTLGVDMQESDFLDDDDEGIRKFNNLDYAMTLGLIEITANYPTLVSAIKTKMMNNQQHLVNLLDFANEHTAVDTIMNNIFNNRFDDFNNGSWKTYINNNYHYDTTYVPFIRLANVDTSILNLNLHPLVAAPLELNEDVFTELDDHVPIWYKDASGLSYLSSVNEETIANIALPVFVINNGFEGDENYSDFIIPFNPGAHVPGGSGPWNPPPAHDCGNLNHYHEEINLKEFSIGEWYESGNNKSEIVFNVQNTKYYHSGQYAWEGYTLDDGNDEVSYKRAHKVKLSKSNLNVVQNSNYIFFSPKRFKQYMYQCFDIPSSQSFIEHFHISVFERDWINKGKALGSVKNASGTGSSVVYGERRFQNEWYYFDPTTNNSYDFLNRHTWGNYDFTVVNKGTFKSTRVAL